MQIFAAAIKIGETVYSVPSPGRHHHVIAIMVKQGIIPHAGIQGFLTDTGRFVNRLEAAQIATNNGQVDVLYSPPELFSEDLW